MNIVLNIGLNDKKTKKQKVKTDYAINLVGEHVRNCTITPTIGFYKGERENSLKTEMLEEMGVA